MLIIITKEKSLKTINDNYIVLKKVCTLKQVKNKNNIILIGNITLHNDGLIEELGYYIDEIFISTKIDLVITLQKKEKLQEVCDFYNVKLINI